MSFNFKKKYGQNFLVDKNVVLKIINNLNISENNVVIEIGCGDGKLTKFLCEKFDNVIGYEIDNDLENILMDNLKEYDNYEIIFEDFLKRDINLDLKDYKNRNIYVVANLPYYITTPIIQKIIDSKINIKAMNLMVQKEVGDRFCAKVGSKDYSSLTVYLNYYFDIKKLFIVNRNSFLPRPNVDSVIVSFIKKDTVFKLNNQELFFKLVRDSFKFKRKTLKNNLKEYDLQKVEQVLKKYNYDLSCRAEQLSLEVFVDIANSL